MYHPYDTDRFTKGNNKTSNFNDVYVKTLINHTFYVDNEYSLW